jgi:hypothetical protein
VTVTVHETGIVIRRRNSRRLYFMRMAEAVRVLAVRSQMGMIAQRR